MPAYTTYERVAAEKESTQNISLSPVSLQALAMPLLHAIIE
jgi:hypothetical protein